MGWKKWSLAGGLGIVAIWMAWWDKSYLITTTAKAKAASSQSQRFGGAKRPIGSTASNRLGRLSAPSRLGALKAVHRHTHASAVKPTPLRPVVMAKIPKDACDIIILVEGMTWSASCPLRVSQAIRAVKGVLQVDVSYLKKVAFVRASKPLCSKKGAQMLLDAIKKLPKYKGEIYEIKPAKVQSPALHLLQRKLIRKAPQQKHPTNRPIESKKSTKKKKDDKEKDQGL